MRMEAKMERSKKTMHIGDLAQRAGASIHTIRYYEEEGLLEKPQRSDGRFRLYSNEAVERLKFIRKAQQLGLSLSEIKKIIRCSQEGLKPCCSMVKKVFEEKIKEFERKIAELTEMKANLEKLLAEWIPLSQAKRRSYAVCPQIEKEPKVKKRR